MDRKQGSVDSLIALKRCLEESGGTWGPEADRLAEALACHMLAADVAEEDAAREFLKLGAAHRQTSHLLKVASARVGKEWPRTGPIEKNNAGKSEGGATPLGGVSATEPLPDWKIRRLKSLAGNDAVAFAYTTGADSSPDAEWVCVCGTQNPLDWERPLQNCSKCGRERDSTLTDYSEEALEPEVSPPAESPEVDATKDRKAAKNAGLAVIGVAVWTLASEVVMWFLTLGSPVVRDMYSSVGAVLGLLIGLLLFGLGIGTLRKSITCLGVASIWTALLILVGFGHGLLQLIIFLILLGSMLRGFGPISRLKAAPPQLQPSQPSQITQPMQPGQPPAGTVRSLEGFADIEALHKKGLITHEEYQAKRKELLESS